MLFGRFYADFFEITRRWTEVAEQEIEPWPQTAGLGMTTRTRELLEEMLGRSERLGPAVGEGRAPREETKGSLTASPALPRRRQLPAPNEE